MKNCSHAGLVAGSQQIIRAYGHQAEISTSRYPRTRPTGVAHVDLKV
jgi:hypothetical protein